MDGPKGRAADGHLAHLRRLRAAKDVMDRDWADETLDLDAVAARAGYSRSHFVRVFKTAYGRTPGQYLSQRRIERAAEMLRTCDLSITEICHLVGFAGLGTFTTRFKHHMGQTLANTAGRRSPAAPHSSPAATPCCGQAASTRPETAGPATARPATARPKTAILKKPTDTPAAYGGPARTSTPQELEPP